MCMNLSSTEQGHHLQTGDSPHVYTRPRTRPHLRPYELIDVYQLVLRSNKLLQMPLSENGLGEA